MTDKGRVTQQRFFAIVPVAVIYDRNLNHADIRVYATLSERAGTKRRSWPGIRRIASDVNMSTKTVQRAVARLEAAGHLEVDRVSGRSNTYWLPMTVVPSTTPDEDDRGTDDHPSSHQVPQTVAPGTTELNPGTKPSAAAAAFVAFHNRRTWDEVQKRKNRGVPVTSERGLAHAIGQDEDFIAESRRIFTHSDCPTCDGTGFTSTYAPGSGSVQIECTDERKADGDQ